MGDYKRSTQEIAFEAIPADVMQSINTHIAKHNLGDILNDISFCLISNSEKIKKGLFAGPGPKVLAETVILTKRWLILAGRADQNAVHVKSMQLKDILVEDYEKSSFYAMLQDTGMNISAPFADANEQGTIFLPLGKDPAGERFKEVLIESVQEAKK